MHIIHFIWHPIFEPKQKGTLYFWRIFILIGSDVCDLYLDDKKLEEDFKRYEEKDAVCGFVKNRDIVSKPFI